MNRCADALASLTRPGLALLLASALLAGCAGRAKKPDTAPEAAPETPAETAEPAPDKGDPEARFAAALELMKQNKSAEAIAAFQALSADFPDYSGPQTNLGILHAKAKRPNEAIAAFSRAIKLNPENAPAHNWLGILNRETGNYPAARAAYEKAIAIDPDYAAARLNLGLLLEDQIKDPEAALAQYREYLRITDGKDLRVLPWIAEIEARRPKAEAPAAEPEAKP